MGKGAYVNASITWELADEVEGVSITADGLLTTSVVETDTDIVVKAVCGELSKTVTITITAMPVDESLSPFNINFGEGIIAQKSIKDGKKYTSGVTFSKGDDGIGNLGQWENTANGYYVLLKERVFGDYSVEFTVSGFQATNTDSRFMLSTSDIGGNMHVIYDVDNNRMQLYTWGYAHKSGVNSSNWTCQDFYSDWVNNFDTTADHTFKFSVENGMYKVYVDGAYVTFTIDGGACGAIRFTGDIGGHDAKIATKNCTMTVTDVKVTNGALTGTKFVKADYVTDVVIDNTDGQEKLTITAVNQGWYSKDRLSAIAGVVGSTAITNDLILEFDFEFSAAMADGKLALSFGNKLDVYICNKGGNITVNSHAGGSWDEASTGQTNKARIRIVKVGNVISVYAGAFGQDIANDAQPVQTQTNDDVSAAQGGLAFWIINGGDSWEDYKTVTATVSNLSISEYTPA